MRILIIANGYPDVREPQWGCFERDQALALKEQGNEVSIMYIDRRFRKYWRKIGITKKKDQGLSVYGMFYLPMGWLRDKVSYRLHQKIVMWLYDKLFHEYQKDHGKPDVIYAHYVWNISYMYELKDKFQIPLVGIEHWSGMTKEHLTPIGKYWGELAYSYVDKLLAVSKSLQVHIKRHFGKDSIVVYDMLGQEFLSPTLPERERCGHFKFIAIGSLLPIKGYDLLISAFAKSGLSDKGCTLSIVGSGTERNRLEQKIKETKQENSIILLGSMTKEEIVHLLHESHVFVLSSKAETFGVACIEALSQGLPAIATKCGGPEEIIDSSNGILVEPENEDEMADAMKRVYDDYEKYDRELISKNCLDKFSPHVIACQLTEIFKEVTK